jgi:hypothetical protein
MISSQAAMPRVRGGHSPPGNMFAFGQGAANLDIPGDQRQLPVDELELRHLRSPGDFDAVRALRAHIDLSAHLGVDPRFHEHEKKEMSWAWPSHSRCEGKSSEPSGRSRCVTA